MDETEPRGLELICASRTEDLLERLIDDLARSLPPDPLDRACVIVQNRGMARWLELQLGARLGVWANPWFPFPRPFVDWLVRQVRGPADESFGRPVDADALRWAVAAALPGLLDADEFEPLRWWLGPDREPARLLALAGRISAVFDHYLLHAPEWLVAWEEGGPAATPAEDARDTEAWQSALWRAVLERLGPERRNAARRTRELSQALQEDLPPRVRRLRRVSVFGVSALSPAYLDVLAAVAAHVPVGIYTLVPSPSDAGLIAEVVRASAGRYRAAARLPADEVAQRLLAARDVHPLVAGQAGAVRAFQALAQVHGALTVTLDETAGEPWRPTSLLEHLQSDIRAGGPPRPCPERVRRARCGEDLSIGLHACHGPLREAEVARDQILASFDAMPDLAPHDVVVMVPDVERYAPYVEAVFGVGHDEGTAIIHRVADRPAVSGRPGVEALRRALDVLRGRMTAPEVLDLLAMRPVREALGLDSGDIETLKGWIEEGGIRWGLDAGHRVDVGQPRFGANTWRWGLARLVVGWAAPGDGRHRLAETLPLASAGAAPHSLGAMLAFLDFLERWRAEMAEACWPLERWADRIGALCAEMLGDEPDAEDDRVYVEAALGRIAARSRDAGFDTPLPMDAVCDVVGEVLAAEAPPRGFLEGAVTVCALVPMRAIPFRVVVLVGMNDGVFPRADRAPDFDLAARQRCLGDTTKRETDRLLFLEAVLSARDRLVITWSGRDPSSDAEMPPSVVVSELLDVLVAMGAGPERIEAGELIVRHALHPFSPRYYSERPDGKWFSYAPDRTEPSVAAQTARSAARVGRPPLVSERLPDVVPAGGEADAREVPLEDLARFLESPARRLVRERLGVVLPEQTAPLADREPLEVAGLDEWTVGEAMVRALLDGAAPDEAVAAALAGGRVPLGTPGALAAARIRARAERIVALASVVRGHARERSAALELPIGDGRLRIVGALDGLLPAGRLVAGYGRLDDKRRLRVWVQHLALCVAGVEGLVPGGSEAPAVSWVVGRATDPRRDLAAVRFGPVDDARAHLERIVGLWLEAEVQLLPFYPRAARAFATELAKATARRSDEGAAEAVALRRASEQFSSGARWSPGDLADPHLALALGDALPWDADGETQDPVAVARFAVLARRIYEPLDAALAEAQAGDVGAWLAAELGLGEGGTPP